MNFYPFHIGDYISHTSHLTDEEDLAYRRMMDLYYLNEKPFPRDAEWIAKRVKSTIKIVSELLEEYFEFNEDDDCFHNSRADKEIAKYKFLQESGKKGAEKRWGNKDVKPIQSDANSPPIANPLATKTITNTITNTNIKTIQAPEGVSDSVFNDYLEVRKGKKAKWTETALKGLVREAGKAGISLNQAMTICCERNWVSLKAEWLKQDQPKEAKMSNFWAQIEGNK